MNWDSALYDQKHSFVFKYGEDLVSLLDPKAGERILDVGCGTGHLTGQIAQTGAEAVGIDSSAEMIEAARAAYPGIRFEVADAADFSFAEPFDAIFSNAALHWVARAEEAVVCMSWALKPGGRFVAEFGGKGNVKSILGAVERAIEELAGFRVNASNYFPGIGDYSPLLERHGIEVISAELYDRPTRLEDGAEGLRNWIMMFRRGIMNQVAEDQREPVLKMVEELLREDLFRDGHWFADYRRLRLLGQKG